MWKKNEGPMPSNTEVVSERQSGARPKALIGASLSLNGELTGAEDLLIEGVVEGTINLKQNVVTVGKSGRVQAQIHAKIIHVEGEVQGDLFAAELVIVHRTGQVRGNISAPRVSLEEGAKLKGAIDTEREIQVAAITPGAPAPERSIVPLDQAKVKKGNQDASEQRPAMQ